METLACYVRTLDIVYFHLGSGAAVSNFNLYKIIIWGQLANVNFKRVETSSYSTN